MKTPVRDEIRSRIPHPRAIQDMIAFAGDTERLLREIIEALPINRDWLDPELEKQAKLTLDIKK